jgi:UDP-glucose 4-epimerase
MKILVTGGAGFIGSHLAETLVASGHRVRVIDDLSGGHRRNLHAVRGDVEFLKGDCADPAAARRAVKGMEVVFHQAAMPSVARSVEDPGRSHRHNATATVTLLDAARRAGVRRVVYAGSSSVYGDSPELPKREDMPPRPLSPYGVEKLTGEHYLRVFAHLFGMETLTLRYFNVFGPRQDPGSPYSGVISRFATALLARRKPVIFGDGEQSRDFTYVADAVQANLRALDARGLGGQSLNVACGRRVSLNELLKVMAAGAGRPAEAVRRKPRAGDIRHSLADLTLVRKTLGYRPRVPLAEGIRLTLDWYRQNPD